MSLGLLARMGKYTDFTTYAMNMGGTTIMIVPDKAERFVRVFF